MTPKKTANAKNPSAKRKITEKMPKRTVKKEKSKLNMPVNLKVSIPFTTNSSEEGIHVPIVRGRGAPRFKKDLSLETKIELANSVARQQLVKLETPEVGLVTIENVVKSPKRGRPSKTKVVSNFFQDRVVINNNSTEGVVSSTVTKAPEKKVEDKKPSSPRRIVTRKRLADSTAQNNVKRQKKTEEVKDNIRLEQNTDVINSTVSKNDPVVLPQPVDEQPKTINKPQSADQQSPLKVKKIQPVCNEPPTNVKPKPRANRQKSTIQPSTSKKPKPMKQPVQRKKRTPKGKQEVIRDKSPSLLDWLTKLPKKTEGEVSVQPDEPKPVDSRKASISSNSNLSWTKDISSSSTATCITVSSNDFVRFNKKLPILKLTNIDSELKKRNNTARETVDVDHADDDTSDSSDSSSDCSITDKKTDRLDDPIDVNSLHLSASSPPSSRLSQTRSKGSIPDYAKAAEKLSLTLKKLDLEIINWISSENEDIDPDLEKFKNKMFDILDSEFGVITHCRRLKEILDPPKIDDIIDETISKPVEESTVIKEIENPSVQNAPKEIIKEVEFVKPRPCRKLSVVSDVNVSNADNRASRDEVVEDNDLDGNYPYYDHHDDDDTLSLFAESITGLESSRVNTSNASVSAPNTRPVEEYIPQPITDNSVTNTEKHTYCPTKINERAENVTSKIQIICEKQNADSTSIYKQSVSTEDSGSYQDFNENTDLDTRIGPAEIKKPHLMETYFEIVPRARSVVFANLCFYNLINGCRKMMFGQCRFLHVIPSIAQIKAKLKLLDERMFIQEYLLLRNWIHLKRRYGMCYVEECASRGMTRILVEMAYDSIVKVKNDSDEDKRLRVNTIEVTLLHLNSVDLSVCEDLLKLTIHSDQVNRTLLCDVFMATMSITQNFSRFKEVFLNLTYFMVDNDRTFNKDVVEHFLERVCILPFEEPVARALIQMMRLTKSEIFKNSMIGHFEKQISVNKDVFEEYTLLKNQYEFTSMLASAVASSPPMKIDPQSVQSEGDSQPPAASPDTTNLDNMSKIEKPSQPLITRTIGMNPPIIFSRNPASPGDIRVHDSPNISHENPGPSKAHENFGSSKAHENFGPSRIHTGSGSSNSDEIVNIRKWRNRSIFPHLRPPPMAHKSPMRPPVRTPLRPPMGIRMRMPQRMPFNQRLVTFRSPVNYGNRLPGPKY